MSTHFPDSISINEADWNGETEHNPTEQDWETTKTTVDVCKIRWAITTFSPFKAPGPDGIYPALLQWGLDDLIPHLERMFRSSLALRHIPKVWREVKVVFIPKPGKADYSLPKAYRPISLTSFVLKTMERLCDRYIRDIVFTRRTNPPTPIST